MLPLDCAPPVPVSGAWRCAACSAVFASSEEQRAHYREEWHRYNLQRRVAGLAGVPRDEYDRRLEAAAAPQPTPQSVRCDCCSKTFSSSNALASHLSSRRHRQAAARTPPPPSATPPPNAACTQMTSTSVGDVFTHVVPMGAGAETDSATDVDTDSDTEELDSDEWEQWSSEPTVLAAVARRCLFCPRSARSWPKALRHMAAAHSFFVPDEEYCVDVPGLLAYLSGKINLGCMCIWCDRGFQSPLSTRQHMRALGHCRPKLDPSTSVQYSQYYDYSTSYPTEEGKMGEASEECELEEGAEVEPQHLAGDGWSLMLPTGREIGHRELQRYYRQRLRAGALVSRPTLPSPAPRPLPVLARAQRKAWRDSARASLRLGIKANKFQPHYRPQVNF